MKVILQFGPGLEVTRRTEVNQKSPEFFLTANLIGEPSIGSTVTVDAPNADWTPQKIKGRVKDVAHFGHSGIWRWIRRPKRTVLLVPAN